MVVEQMKMQPVIWHDVTTFSNFGIHNHTKSFLS